MATAAGPSSAPAANRAVPTDPPPAIRVARLAHRASASAVGLLVALLALFGWKSFDGGQRLAAAVALADTVFLAWLGRYTPHDLPLVTVGNVAGGMLLAAALAWIAAARPGAGRSLPAVSAFVLLAALLLTGTMTGSRGAVQACPDWLCVDGARVTLAALDPRLPGELPKAEQLGLHLAHRALALGFLLAALAAAGRGLRARERSGRVATGLLAGLLAAQVALGLGTALGSLPLVTATLHNAVAMSIAAALAALAAATPVLAPTRRLRASADRDRFAASSP